MHDSWNDQRGNLEPGHTLLPGRRFLGKEKLHTSEQYSQSSPTPPTMPITSNYPDLPLQESDIFSFLFSRKDRPFPDDKVIFQDGEDLSRQSTFAQVKQSAVDFGKGLKNIFKVRKGDVLAIFAPNDIDFAPVVFGALWAGCVVSPANPGYTVGELAFQLKDSAAKAVACHLSVLETVKKACNEVDIPHSNIFTIGTKSDPTQRIRHWTSMRDSEEGGTRDRSPKFAPKNDPAFLVYSSGTTGKPKGVTLTHFNMTSNIQQIQLTENWLTWDGSKSCPGLPDAPKGKGDKVLACLPFFHIYGLNILIHSPLYSGVHVLVLPKFEIERWCQLVQDHRVTFSYLVPPIVLLLCKHACVDQYDLSSLRMTNSGAAPLTRELVEALFARTGVRVKQGYGLSETSPTIFVQRWQDWDKPVGACGWMVPNCQAKFCAVGGEDQVRDTTELPRGETGELYIKGPNIFKGYHNNAAATRDCLSDDGWFRTGDVGHVDDAGNLFITDRAKELIKYKGFQVAPAELEGYLADHPEVDDVAVVGVESAALGTEMPKAYIVRKGGLKAVRPGDDEEIIRWMNAKVANHKKLRGGIKFVDEVPKSASGKILRRVLKEDAKKEMEAMNKKLKAKL